MDDGYYAFAESAGWDEAGSSLGRSLWDFVAGADLEKIQRMLVRRIRGEARSVDLPFRCDGPAIRREMEINIASSAGGRFVLFSARLRSEELRPDFQPLLSSQAPRDEELLTMCGWCDRFLVGGQWVEVEEAAARLGLFERSAMPTISHDICSNCSETLMAA